MNGKRKVSKIAIRMTALFLVVVLPLTIFATVGYLENRASLERKTLEGIHQKARQTADTMEEHMWNIFNAHSALNVDEKIMYMIGSHDYLDDDQRYSNMRNVFERISSIKLILPAIREIRLHVPSLQRTFYSNWTATKLTEECQYYMDHIDRFYTIRTGENTLTLACGYPWLAEHKYRYYLVTDIDCEALKNGVTVISSMGTAKKIEGSKVYITTLDKTSYDPLAKKMRSLIDKKMQRKVNVVTSSEIPKKSDVLCSSSFVPGIAGLMITSFIINDVIKKR